MRRIEYDGSRYSEKKEEKIKHFNPVKFETKV